MISACFDGCSIPPECVDARPTVVAISDVLTLSNFNPGWKNSTLFWSRVDFIPGRNQSRGGRWIGVEIKKKLKCEKPLVLSPASTLRFVECEKAFGLFNISPHFQHVKIENVCLANTNLNT